MVKTKVVTRAKKTTGTQRKKKSNDGKKVCNLGSTCPYINEYQHQLEFSHEAQVIERIPFQGPGHRLNATPAVNVQNVRTMTQTTSTTTTSSSTSRGHVLGSIPNPNLSLLKNKKVDESTKNDNRNTQVSDENCQPTLNRINNNTSSVGNNNSSSSYNQPSDQCGSIYNNCNSSSNSSSSNDGSNNKNQYATPQDDEELNYAIRLSLLTANETARTAMSRSSTITNVSVVNLSESPTVLTGSKPENVITRKRPRNMSSTASSSSSSSSVIDLRS